MDKRRVRCSRDLVAWQKAFTLAGACHRVSRRFPPEEAYGITPRLRRAAASVAANTAERCLRIAHASLRETEKHLLRAEDLGYVDRETAAGLLALASDVGRLPGALIRSLGGQGASGCRLPPPS